MSAITKNHPQLSSTGLQHSLSGYKFLGEKIENGIRYIFLSSEKGLANAATSDGKIDAARVTTDFSLDYQNFREVQGEPPTKIRKIEKTCFAEARDPVPALPQGFVKREDFDFQEAWKKADKKLQSILVLSGISGTGKSTLAASYANGSKNEYQKILWAKGADLRSAFSSIATASDLGFTEHDSEDVEVFSKNVWDHLHVLKNRKSKLLIVFDDVENLTKLIELLSKLPGTNIRVLITTKVNEQVENVVVHEVGLFSRSQSIDVLKKLTNKENSLFELIAEKLRDTPSAIHFVGLLMKKGTSAEDCLNSLENHASLSLNQGNLAKDSLPLIEGVYAVMFDAVSKLNPLSLEILKFACFLSPRNIPITLLQQEDNAEFDAAKGILLKYALLKKEDRDGEFYSIYPAIQHSIRERITHANELEKILDSLYLRFETMWQFDEKRIEASQEIEDIFPHIGEVVTFPHSSPSLQKKQAVFLDQMGVYKALISADTKTALVCFKQGLKIRKALFGEEHPDFATSLSHLGSVYAAQRSDENAISCLTRALTIRKKLENDNESIAIDFNLLGKIFSFQKKFETAIECYNNSLSRFKVLKEEQRQIVKTALNSLGNIYHSQEKHEIAIKYYKQAMKMCDEKENKNTGSAQIWNNLGAAFSAQKKYKEAHDCYNKSLDAIEKNPENALRFAQVFINISSLFFHQKEYEMSMKYGQCALKVFEEIYGEDHVDVAPTVCHLGDISEAQENYAQAVHFHDRTHLIYKKRLGENHPTTLTALERLVKAQSHFLAQLKKESHSALASGLRNGS